MEDWLYNEGFSTTKQVYQDKLAQLKKLGDPIFNRLKEDENRADAVSAFVQTVDHFKALAQSTVRRRQTTFFLLRGGRKGTVLFLKKIPGIPYRSICTFFQPWGHTGNNNKQQKCQINWPLSVERDLKFSFNTAPPVKQKSSEVLKKKVIMCCSLLFLGIQRKPFNCFSDGRIYQTVLGKSPIEQQQ